MTDIPLARSDYSRGVAKEAQLYLRNRYYEANPVLTGQQVALISRPGQRRWLAVGDGPIRGIYSQPGTFNDDLFVVSGANWYRVTNAGVITLLQAGIKGGGGPVSMAAAGNIGTTPEYMFLADGSILWLYIENGYAIGTLSGTFANGDTVQVGGIYYKFTNGSVDAGAPAGTLANPWLVALDVATPLNNWQNLSDAFGDQGTPGTVYSTALVANDQIEVTNTGATSVSVRATAIGAAGNAIATTKTGAGVAWSAATLTGGGAPTVTQVQTPGDVGIISLGYISSYVICVPAQGEGINGQFFWLEPGETTIDPLDFATAERSPDPILGVVVFEDNYWLPGSDTTEVWYFTGNPDSPTLRLQGVTFDRGTWEGTAVKVKESMIIVDSDGGVFQISGGLQRISLPGIEEEIRKAIAFQASRLIIF